MDEERTDETQQDAHRGGPASAAHATSEASMLPSWMTDQWPLVSVLAFVVLAMLFALGSLYGMVLALIAEGGTEAIVPGLLVGAYLAFAAVGAESTATSAFSTAGDGVEVSVGLKMIPFGLWAVFAWLVWRAARSALRRTGAANAAAVAVVVKLALAISIPLGVVGSILTFDDSVLAEDFISSVSGGAAFVYGFAAALAIGLVVAVRLGRVTVPDALAQRLAISDGARELAWSVRAGARAFVWLVILGAVGVLILAVLSADDPAERTLLVVAAPIYLVNLGVATAVFAMGGSVAFTGATGAGHVSLLNFGFPPGLGAGSAPVYWFVALAAAPVLVWITTRRRLASAAPDSDERLFAVCVPIALGFAGTAWVAAAISEFSLAGGAHDIARGFAAVALEPSLGAALGFGLLWGAVGALACGYTWGRSRGLLRDPGGLIPAIPGDGTAEDGSGAASGEDDG